MNSLSDLTLVITAVHGNLAQSIIKALRTDGKQPRLIGCDITEFGAGSAFVNSFSLLPPGTHPEYVDAIDDLARKVGAAAVIPASEPEIFRLGPLPSRNLPCGSAIICQPGTWLERFGDKLVAMRGLAEAVRLAPFGDGRSADDLDRMIEEGFPLIVKERRSSGSKAVRKVECPDELAVAVGAMQAPLVQGYLDDTGGEFSVGVFRARGHARAIAFRRELGPEGCHGCSWYAETVHDPDVLEYAIVIAEASFLEGAANVQVRVGLDGPRLLEINPRFSSLVAARAACGFRDVEWSLWLQLDQEVELPERFREVRFHRFIHEVVDEGDGFHAPFEWAPVGTVGEEGDADRA